jgi:hypothetical protein
VYKVDKEGSKGGASIQLSLGRYIVKRGNNKGGRASVLNVPEIINHMK